MKEEVDVDLVEVVEGLLWFEKHKGFDDKVVDFGNYPVCRVPEVVARG